MFSLTIVFGPGPMVWTLMFKTEEAAQVSSAQLNAARTSAPVTPNCTMELADDFGQVANFSIASIHGTMLEDMEQSKLAHIERALHQARVKVKADEMARADPVIRAAAMQGGGTILQPAMPGMAPNGRAWS